MLNSQNQSDVNRFKARQTSIQKHARTPKSTPHDEFRHGINRFTFIFFFNQSVLLCRRVAEQAKKLTPACFSTACRPRSSVFIATVPSFARERYYIHSARCLRRPKSDVTAEGASPAYRPGRWQRVYFIFLVLLNLGSRFVIMKVPYSEGVRLLYTVFNTSDVQLDIFIPLNTVQRFKNCSLSRIQQLNI